MTYSLDRPSQANDSVESILSRVLAEAGVARTDSIYVTGAAGLAALLWFCRHGYQKVGCVLPGRGQAHEIDLLFTPQTQTVASLAGMLRQGLHPRDGGVLIVQMSPGSVPDTDDAAALLTRYGYRIERRLTGHHRDLIVARRFARPPLRLAA